jgi:MFS family permease
VTLLSSGLPPDARRIVAARAIRGLADGCVSVLLPAHLLALGHGPEAVGWIASATLLGSALLTLAVGFGAARLPLRGALLAATVLMAATGVGFAGLRDLAPLLLVAFVGTLNPHAGDVSVFLPLEHALLARLAPEAGRTTLFARYATAGALAMALGALAAGLPDLLARLGWLPHAAGLRAGFGLYVLAALASAALYQGLRLPAEPAGAPAAALGPSRRRLLALAALFSLDAFGGGLVVQSLLALWLFGRFEVSLGVASLVFFASGLLGALAQLGAPALARRIGLVPTMVFPHLVANACLAGLAFAPNLGVALALLGVRSLLSTFDVPARSAYVMSVVTPAERAAAASVTSVPRSLAGAAGPALAGWLFAASSFAWPLLLAGLLKGAYDLALLAAFGRARAHGPRDAA